MCAVYCRFFSCFPIFKANWNKLVSCRRQKAFGMQSAMTLCCSVSDSVSSFFGLRHWPTNLGECSDHAEITAEIGRDRQTRTDGEKKRRSCHLRTRWICVCSCALNWWCQMWVLHIFCLILSSEVDYCPPSLCGPVAVVYWNPTATITLPPCPYYVPLHPPHSWTTLTPPSPWVLSEPLS